VLGIISGVVCLQCKIAHTLQQAAYLLEYALFDSEPQLSLLAVVDVLFEIGDRFRQVQRPRGAGRIVGRRQDTAACGNLLLRARQLALPLQHRDYAFALKLCRGYTHASYLLTAVSSVSKSESATEISCAAAW